ncbi:hypothetical protein E4U57_004218 [Claviceps arundinis]|uniref:Uncharacterized protein n=1 Tax=Claviceps arundinis TaxID=1623583 RepID=A0ABQ7P972_9HYPO|nr:hypothetical protein E4U57_004218 [Claviceps arundinis]
MTGNDLSRLWPRFMQFEKRPICHILTDIRRWKSEGFRKLCIFESHLDVPLIAEKMHMAGESKATPTPTCAIKGCLTFHELSLSTPPVCPSWARLEVSNSLH